MSISKEQLALMEEDEKNAEQLEAYNKEQDRLAKLFEEQELKVKIEEAKALLIANGYKVSYEIDLEKGQSLDFTGLDNLKIERK